MIELLFENEDIWVYNKPSNVSVLKDRSGETDLWSELKKGSKPYLVHRLDKGTSGVWLVAKSAAAQAGLTRAFSERTVSKFYLALVDGETPRHTHHIDLPLTKGRKSRYRIAGQRESIRCMNRTYSVHQDREGVAALTSFRTLGSSNNRSLVLVRPKTGRSHQIRVHLAWLGFPIVGDTLYNPGYYRGHNPGNDKDQNNGRNGGHPTRMCLHAHYLRVPGLAPFRTPIPEVFSLI